MELGERIRQARLAARLSLRALGEKADLSATAISKYETGKNRPGQAALLRLARGLGVATEYFFRPMEVRLECPAYRRHASLAARVQASIENTAKEALERYLALESVFPPERWPQLHVEPSLITRVEDTESVAEEIRSVWRLGLDAIGDLSETLESVGVKVLLLEAPRGFDGFSCWANGRIPVIISRAELPGDRQRLNLVHELGHLLLIADAGIDQERAAYRFAGAFLVPRETALRELGTHRDSLSDEELAALKRKYGMSMQAWVRRALDVGVISNRTYTEIQKRFGAKGWCQREPDPQLLPEKPRRFRLLLDQALTEKLITPARAAQLIGRLPAPSRTRPSAPHLEEAVKAARRLYERDAELTAFTTANTEDLVDV